MLYDLKNCSGRVIHSVDIFWDVGKCLELVVGPSVAAAIIYMESYPDLVKIPDFHAGHAAGLAEIKKLAGVE